MVARKRTPPVNSIALGKRVQELRRNRDWTQAALAERTRLSQATISQVENAERTPGVDALAALAEAFDVTIEFLTHGDRDAHERDPEVEVFFRDAERLSKKDREILKHHLSLLLDRAEPKKKRGS